MSRLAVLLLHLACTFLFVFYDCLRLISFFQASVCCSKQIYFATKNVASFYLFLIFTVITFFQQIININEKGKKKYRGRGHIS